MSRWLMMRPVATVRPSYYLSSDILGYVPFQNPNLRVKSHSQPLLTWNLDLLAQQDFQHICLWRFGPQNDTEMIDFRKPKFSFPLKLGPSSKKVQYQSIYDFVNATPKK